MPSVCVCVDVERPIRSTDQNPNPRNNPISPPGPSGIISEKDPGRTSDRWFVSGSGVVVRAGRPLASPASDPRTRPRYRCGRGRSSFHHTPRGTLPSVDQPKNRREWADDSVRSSCWSATETSLRRPTTSSSSCLISRMTPPNANRAVRFVHPVAFLAWMW